MPPGFGRRSLLLLGKSSFNEAVRVECGCWWVQSGAQRTEAVLGSVALKQKGRRRWWLGGEGEWSMVCVCVCFILSEMTYINFNVKSKRLMIEE